MVKKMNPQDKLTEMLPFSDREYDGLVITSHAVKDAKSKERASKRLYNWQFASLTVVDWITTFRKGTHNPTVPVHTKSQREIYTRIRFLATYPFCFL